MFKSKKGKNPQVTSESEENLSETPKQKTKKKVNWLKVSIIVNGLIIVGVGVALGAMAVLHQSDTNPQFCGTCHNMDSYVESYTSSKNMDNVPCPGRCTVQAMSQCLWDSRRNRIRYKFITGNYDKDMPNAN